MENRTRYLSPSFISLFGWTLEDVEGKNIPYIPESEKKSYRALIKDITENGRTYQDYETKRVTKEGRLLDVSLNAFRYYDHEKTPSGVMYTLRDMSEKKNLEAQLIRAQKMEAIGTLAGGIAHDFNNNLQAIFGCMELLRMTKDSSHPDYDKLLTIEKSAQRASNLSRQLLGFSSEMENRFRPVDLNRVIEQVSKILERTIPKMINIELDLENRNQMISGDSGQLEQVLMNFGVNARDAMPDGGRLIFKTRSLFLDEEYCSANPGYTPGKYILLTISDDGCGMDEETLGQIFKPFFTTKKRGEGTGLGLAMVHGIVKKHGGLIECSSECDYGTTFSLYFPAIESHAELIEKTSAESDSLEGGYETILIVDDEESNRELGKEILANLGYDVITAADCEAAFKCYQKNMGKIDLVILDLIMPGRGGKRLLKDLLRLDPSARIIISSGYYSKEAAREVMESGAMDFISKPYEMKMMLKVIRRIFS